MNLKDKLALHHINKKSSKNSKFPTTNKGINFLVLASDIALVVEVI